MPCPAKVWLREADGYYYTTFRGTKIKLSRDKAAEREFHALRTQAPVAPAEPAGGRVSARKLADLFLTHAHQTKEPATYDLQRYFLQSFCDHVKGKKAADVKVADVTGWLLAANAAGKKRRRLRGRELPHGAGEQTKLRWGVNSQTTARAVVRACFNWGVEQGHLTHSPVGRLKTGGYHRRERILTPEERDAVHRCIRDGMFADFYVLIAETGMWPFSEAGRVTPAMIDWKEGTVTFEKHKNSRKGKRRVVYLTDRAKEVLRRRADDKAAGEVVFHTRNGFPFTGPNTVQRLRRIEARLGIPRFSLYALRKLWITTALEKGLSSDIVAELAGNSPKVIAKYYSFLSDKRDTLRAAARRVTATT